MPHNIHEENFYIDNSLEEIIITMQDAIAKNFEDVYKDVFTYSNRQYQRVDVLEYLFSLPDFHKEVEPSYIKDTLSSTIIRKRYDCAKFLLKNGVMIDIENRGVKWALGESNVELIKLIHSTGFDVTRSENNILYSALRQYPANYSIMDYLIEHGANFEYFRKDIYSLLIDNDGRENINKLKYLVSKGFDITHDDCKLLMMTVRNGMKNMTETILSLYPHVYPTEHNLFNICAVSNYVEMFDIIINSGLLLDNKDNNIIAVAATYGNVDNIEYLVNKGFDIEVAKEYGSEETLLWCEKKIKERLAEQLDLELTNKLHNTKKIKM